MRRVRSLSVPLMALLVGLSATACTPEELEGIGRTVGQLLMFWLWGMLPPHP